MIDILAQCPSCGEWLSVQADEHTPAGYPHELLADVMCPQCYEVSHVGDELNWRSKRREFFDEETRLNLVFDPTPDDPGRVSIYAPRNCTLTDGQINEAIKRLLARARNMEIEVENANI